MYNLYTHEKKIFENKKQESDYLLKKKTQKKRKEEIDILSKNYERRMQNFIFSMCDKPIKLHKNININEKNKSFSIGNFRFGEFKTDKQRLKIMESYKDKLKLYEQKRKDIEKKRNILKIKNHRNYILLQPEMRFSTRTKLEKIIEKIKKDDIANVEILDLNLLEHKKNIQYGEVRKIQEFYNYIDKEDLKDPEIQKIIELIGNAEQSESNSKYTLKNYIEWKYHKNITNNSNTPGQNNKISEESNNKNVVKLTKNKNKKLKAKNEYEVLVKDDFKTHFKGASQYVELLDEKNKKDNKRKKNYGSSNKRLNSSLTLKSISSKNWKNFIPLDRKNYKSSRNSKIKIMKRPSSVMNLIAYKNKSENSLLINKSYKKENSLNELNDELRKKKLMMINSMNKEIKNSIASEFMNKYNSIYLLKNINTINVHEDLIFQKIGDFPGKDEGLKEKLAKLSKHLEKERRRIHNEKYKQFVKRFTRSLFGFKSKEMQEKIDEVKADNKLDYVVIDGKVYPKKDIKNITEVIFRKCNYYNTKK